MAEKRLTSNLPEEIMEEILYNLPIKSVLRFKCVSKSWLSTISSKTFIKDHLKRSIAEDEEKPGLKVLTNRKILFNYVKPAARLSYSIGSFSLCKNPKITPTLYDIPIQNVGFMHIIGSCNGLILIMIEGKLVLWNPSTRIYRVIPSPSFNEAIFLHDGPFHVRYGFGYDESNDDYKVICIKDTNYFPEPYHYETRMYSSKTNSWKKFDNCEKHLHGTHDGILVNGRLHWLVQYNRSTGSRDIVSLDLAEEKYQTFSHGVEYSSGVVSLVELGGYLGLMNLMSGADVNVWVMKEYGVTESWTKVWTLSNFIDQLPRKCVGDIGKLKPLCWSKNGDISIAFGQYVVVCNGKNVLRKSRVGSVFEHRIQPIVYVESLVSA
ncbi:hypothetical protein ABFS82_14G006000 [Erythranthe guttata]|nr:PREDICTED: F-box/kelch-repeat protein At3g23880-like [Erythranthe guttata]|eukprot:XP_012842159.1 PREDICTED: F-box/kelch-repeat protein At3g23880-like [Erythranthe guttata]